MTRQDYTQHRTKRTYSRKFKAELVDQCLGGDVSVASLATAHGMNQNVLHRWINEHRRYGMHDLSLFEEASDVVLENSVSGNNNWLPILPQQSKIPSEYKKPLPNKKACASNQSSGDINLELSSDKLSVKLNWPDSNPSGLARFIKELMA